MKWEAKVDKRGRVTLPKAMRDELGIRPGDDFDFRVVGTKILVTRRSDLLTFKMIILSEQAA